MNMVNQLIIPTAKRAEVDGELQLGDRAEARVLTAASYYFDHQSAFIERDAFLLCVGGYSLRNGDQPITDVSKSEAGLSEQLLKQLGVVNAEIRTQGTSASIYGSIGYAVAQGWLDPSIYNSRHRLGLVAPVTYAKRIGLVLGALGIEKDAIELIEVRYEQEQIALEGLLRMWTRYKLQGVTKPEELIDIEEKLTQQKPRQWWKLEDKPLKND